MALGPRHDLMMSATLISRHWSALISSSRTLGCSRLRCGDIRQLCLATRLSVPRLGVYKSMSRILQK